ncbi:MAG TPA: hypothetical protein VFR86_11520 [Burkholderiaceae bacterium]|nr:hypothetical protein [Burkholderiaceae bacterium]
MHPLVSISSAARDNATSARLQAGRVMKGVTAFLIGDFALDQALRPLRR